MFLINQTSMRKEVLEPFFKKTASSVGLNPRIRFVVVLNPHAYKALRVSGWASHTYLTTNQLSCKQWSSLPKAYKEWHNKGMISITFACHHSEVFSKYLAGEIYRTAQHEFTHLKEFINGELDPDALNRAFGNRANMPFDEYRALPWEARAEQSVADAEKKGKGAFSKFSNKECLALRRELKRVYS